MFEVQDQESIRQTLEELLSRSETTDLEFKTAQGGLPKSLWETYSAFANTDGGTIILGVSEKNHKFYLEGIKEEQAEKFLQDFWNNVNNPATVNINLLSNSDVTIEDFKGYKFLLIRVPQAIPEQRPVHRGPNPYNGTYKRNNEGDYLCNPKEVQRMFADADVSCPADSRILNGYTMADIDSASLKQYRQLFSTAKPDHSWLAYEDLELLTKLGGYRRDRKTGKEGFTLAGLLMFGKSEAITDPECSPTFFLDYQECLSDDLDTRWTHRIYSDGTWESNLFQFYRKVMPPLCNALPTPFRLEGDTRIEETPAHKSLREAFVNSCIHADYSDNASIVIKLQKSAFRFSNPGTLLVSKRQYFAGGESVCRNPSLQKMFMMLGKAEKAGSGTGTIMKGWKDCNWRQPTLNTKIRPDRVELIMPMESVLNDEITNALKELFGNQVMTLEHYKLITLSLAYCEDSINNERLQFALDLHSHDITKMLRELCRDNYLVSDGVGRGTKYFLPTESVKDVLPISPDYSSSEESTNVPNIGTTSKGTTSKGTTSKGTTFSANTLPKSTNASRIKKMDLYRMVQQSCIEWKSKEEISVAVNKSVGYLRKTVIPGMISSGYLEMSQPTIINHPQQKYRAKNIIGNEELTLDFKND